MGTVHLGSLGTPRPPVDADFNFFGETIRVSPDASDLHFAELMQRAQRIDIAGLDPDDPSTWDAETVKASQEASTAVWDTIRQQIHPDDWDRFWKTAKANRQGTLDLMALSSRITEAVAGFPTGQPSGSSAGPRGTGRRSRGGSSSRDTTRALTLLRGRPDLQAAVVRANEARQAG